MRLLSLTLLAVACAGSETENHGIRVLPAPGTVAVDGNATDWDLSGGVFACGEVEHLRDRCSVWLHAMHDQDNLYILARWRDPTPLNNPETAGGHGFNGDCLQVRCVIDPDGAGRTATWWSGWRDVTGAAVLDRGSPGPRNGFPDNVLPDLADAAAAGARQAFAVDAAGGGYIQELAIPWRMLSPAGTRPTGRFRLTVEPNFTAGEYGRITIKDIFDPQVAAVDRVFTFRAFKHWGWATVEPAGHVEPQAVRLADGRSFPVAMRDGLPQVDWTGLDRRFAWPGFKPIAFSMPFDGYASLNIVDADGVVVRHLLNWDKRSAGAHTVQWDGLTDAVYRTPGRPVPAGSYTWRAIAHPGATLTLRGWASCSGGAPWISSPLDYWLGDHGVPSAIAGDGTRMFLASNGAEGGRHLLATGLDGKVLWGLQNTTGAADPESIATAGGVVYVLHPRADWSAADGVVISRVDAATGTYQKWPGGDSHMLQAQRIWNGAGPSAFHAIDARDGSLYLTMSQTAIFADDVRDWRALLTAIAADPALAVAALPQDKGRRAELERFADGGLPASKALSRDGVARRLLDALNAMISVGYGGLPARLTVRRDLERRLGAGLSPVEHALVVCDAATGAARARIAIPLAGAVRAVAPDRILVAAHDRLLAVDPGSGAIATVADGLGPISGIANGRDGRILLTLGAPRMQVVELTADGRVVRTIGRDGGRPPVGRFQSDGMLAPAGVALAPDGNLWIAEHDAHPKRVSVWSPAGDLVRDFFGPTHYGASGGAVDPRDPDRMVGVGCEWQIDPSSGQARCLGTFDAAYHEFATWREHAGRQFLYVFQGKYSTGAVKIFERVGYDAGAKHGAFALRAIHRPAAAGAELWTDANGDEVEQPEEIQRRASYLAFSGSNGWSLNLGPDLALYGSDRADKRLKRLVPLGLSACGAPRYDLAAPADLPAAFSEGYLENYSCALPSADNRRILLNQRVKDAASEYQWACYDLRDGRRLWTYPNPYFQVHGSHRAPAPEPGLFRGAFGPIGVARLPGVGGFWTINGNLGEWGVLSDDGFYVTRLFNGNVFEWVWPRPAPGLDISGLPSGCGGEDFGGSLTQAADGKVYIQSGKMALWNIALDGLERTVALDGGGIAISTEDTGRARALREDALQKAAASTTAAVKRTAIAFTGRMTADFAAGTVIAYQKDADAAVKTGLACDGTRLYVGWEVADATPWMNGATDLAQMYACGDTVDLQLGTDPAADPRRQQAAPGDLRLSIGNLAGKPTAVLYRFVAATKQPRTFTSGVVQGWQVDWVGALDDCGLKVAVQPGKGYTVEAAIPLASLGLQLQAGATLRGDVGVTHGDPGGTRTRLRTYWSNQQTGLVDDVVFELRPTPANWGSLVFE